MEEPKKEEYLRTAISSYFDYMKDFGARPTPQRISEATWAAFYSLGISEGRHEYLKDLINCLTDSILAVEYVLSQTGNSVPSLTGDVAKTKRSQTDVMTIEDVVREFGLAKNSVKDKKWRDAHGFPYTQVSAKSSVKYFRSQVKKWIEENANPNH